MLYNLLMRISLPSAFESAPGKKTALVNGKHECVKELFVTAIKKERCACLLGARLSCVKALSRGFLRTAFGSGSEVPRISLRRFRPHLRATLPDAPPWQLLRPFVRNRG